MHANDLGPECRVGPLRLARLTRKPEVIFGNSAEEHECASAEIGSRRRVFVPSRTRTVPVGGIAEQGIRACVPVDTTPSHVTINLSHEKRTCLTSPLRCASDMRTRRACSCRCCNAAGPIFFFFDWASSLP